MLLFTDYEITNSVLVLLSAWSPSVLAQRKLSYYYRYYHKIMVHNLYPNILSDHNYCNKMRRSCK